MSHRPDPETAPSSSSTGPMQAADLPTKTACPSSEFPNDPANRNSSADAEAQTIAAAMIVRPINITFIVRSRLTVLHGSIDQADDPNLRAAAWKRSAPLRSTRGK
ncbi:MAG: hypothetical protein QM775_11110 [Pirellulales bacterium]